MAAARTLLFSRAPLRDILFFMAFLKLPSVMAMVMASNSSRLPSSLRKLSSVVNPSTARLLALLRARAALK
ncbi:hypothetical protein [Mesorhizobium sp. M0684]|uniref:hypothetical protein n=1 Tax=unclassified Mesorhizobium TaxID=325217 RepID=UPI00333DF20D